MRLFYFDIYATCVGFTHVGVAVTDLGSQHNRASALNVLESRKEDPGVFGIFGIGAAFGRHFDQVFRVGLKGPEAAIPLIENELQDFATL